MQGSTRRRSVENNNINCAHCDEAGAVTIHTVKRANFTEGRTYECSACGAEWECDDDGNREFHNKPDEPTDDSDGFEISRTATDEPINGASELDKYAGRVALIKGDMVSGLSDVSKGDVVASRGGKGRQGIVERVSDTTVYVRLATGGIREYHFKETYDDGVARFYMPGAPSKLNRLVKVD